MTLKAALPLMLFSAIALADEYRSFSDVDVSRSESRVVEIDQFTIGSTWYFDQKETLGPLKEFEYINKTSNIFGSYSRFESESGGMAFDSDFPVIGGEYFAGNVLMGGSYRKLDDFEAFSGTLGYLVNSNFLVSLDAFKVEDQDNQYFVSARYNHQLGGSNYIGFNFRTDDDFDTREVSSRYFTQLAGETHLAAELSYTFVDDFDDFWSLGADYYFNKQTSLGLGIAKNEFYSLDFTRFFNRNIAVELGYSTSSNDAFADLDVDTYQLGVTVQF